LVSGDGGNPIDPAVIAPQASLFWEKLFDLLRTQLPYSGFKQSVTFHIQLPLRQFRHD